MLLPGKMIHGKSGKKNKARNKRLHALGGREDLAEVYYRAKDLIYGYRLLHLCRFEEKDGFKQLDISHLWRIQRFDDGSFRASSFSLLEGQWIDEKESCWSGARWPFIPLFPVAQTRSLSWCRTLAEMIVTRALHAAGFDDLPVLDNGMKPGHMADILKKSLLGKYQGRDENDNPLWSGGRYESLLTGARTLRAVFYDHFYEKEMLSGIMLINYQYRSLADYLKYALYRDGFLKVAREHRNLLPLLNYINPECWGRDNLFSRKVWVKDGRKTTALDRKPIKKSFNLCGSFHEPAAWKWLLKASPVLVREISRSNKTLVMNIVLANINFKAPVIAYVCVFRSGLARINAVSTETQRLIRLFLAHCASIWHRDGFNNFRQWLRDQGKASLQDATDYLLQEGLGHGQPDKKSTWASILRRSGDWHQRVAIEMMETQQKINKNTQWEAVISETVLDGIVFSALTTPKALAAEGYELHHCVGSYAAQCLKNEYRVYAVREPDGSRSTLGLRLSGNKAVWDQHRGPYNCSVSEAADQAGRKLIVALQTAKAEQTGFPTD